MSSAKQGIQLCKKQLLCLILQYEKRIYYHPQNILFNSEINTFIPNEDKMKQADLA